MQKHAKSCLHVSAHVHFRANCAALASCCVFIHHKFCLSINCRLRHTNTSTHPPTHPPTHTCTHLLLLHDLRHDGAVCMEPCFFPSFPPAKKVRVFRVVVFRMPRRRGRGECQELGRDLLLGFMCPCSVCVCVCVCLCASVVFRVRCILMCARPQERACTWMWVFLCARAHKTWKRARLFAFVPAHALRMQHESACFACAYVTPAATPSR